jgi:hypothetical protein
MDGHLGGNASEQLALTPPLPKFNAKIQARRKRHRSDLSEARDSQSVS